jgi:uridylate kinase
LARSSSKEQTVVLKLSGSLFFSEEFESVVKAIRSSVEENSRLKVALVAGGGKKAREYIAVAEKFGTDQATLDEIGISVSRLNALVLATSLGSLSVSFVPRTLRQVTETLSVYGDKRIVVLGGLHPGQSTNAVGALVAEKLRADKFVNATDVEGVFTKDPRKYSDAKRLEKVTPNELSRILGEESMRAGGYDLMDPVALKLIERSKIHTWIIKCAPKQIATALTSGKIDGTEIVFT